MPENLIELTNLKKYFQLKNNMQLFAVDDVSLNIKVGETLGLVGESGCGKSTVGRVVTGLLPPTDGDVLFRGKSIFGLPKHEARETRREIQIVFQDPYTSLNPRKTVRRILEEPFIVNHRTRGAKQLNEKVEQLVALTGLSLSYLSKYPHELDGGKRQIVGITRALALNPDFIVCDEPVSALDVSIQAQIINLLMDLQNSLHLTYLFISHDLSVVRHLSKRIAVMYLGKIVELAETAELFSNPQHPYTKALLSAVPTLSVGRKTNRIILSGDVPSPINPKPGCRFYSRCSYAMPICAKVSPTLIDIGAEHYVSCHLITNQRNTEECTASKTNILNGICC